MSACGSVSSILLFHSLTLLPVAEVNEGSLASKREGMEEEAEEDRTKRTGRVGTLTAALLRALRLLCPELAVCLGS